MINNDATGPSEPTVLSKWAGPLVILLTTLIMVQWTWLTWPDAFVDFGRELYTPWQITEGKILYQDLALFNGPLSPYLNACVFVIFGTSLRTLAFCNLLVIFVALFLIYKMITAVAGRLSASLACVTFVTIFAFSQYIGIGNFNWMSPYSHEMTHGIALSLVSLHCFGVFLRSGKKRMAAAAGFALGLVFLTKPEIFAATAAALACGFALWWRSARIPAKAALSVLLVFAGSALLAPALSFLLLSRVLPPKEAFMGTLGSWPYVFHEEHANLSFFHVGMGFDHPGSRLVTLLGWALRYASVLFPVVLIALVWNRSRRGRILFLILLIPAAAALWFLREPWANIPDPTAPWAGMIARIASGLTVKQFARPWPLFLLIVIVVLCVRLVRSREHPKERTHAVLCLVASVFALCLLLKMLLFTRVWHYGFGLAMPAAIILVVVLTDGLPGLIERWGGSAPVFRCAGVALWAVFVVLHLGMTHAFIERKTVAVGSGPDTFYADARGRVVRDAVEAISRSSSEEQTLTVMPDGEMLGYLSRRRNPSPYANYIPATVVLFGEERMLSALQKDPPDFIALVHRDTSEYGFRFFGRDYATRIREWIQQTYEPIHRSGAPVFNERNLFGILLLERKHPSR